MPVVDRKRFSYDNLMTLKVSDEQLAFLKSKADVECEGNISQYLRKLVNEEMAKQSEKK